MTSAVVTRRSASSPLARRHRAVRTAVVVVAAAVAAGGLYAVTRDSPAGPAGPAGVGVPPVAYTIEYRTSHGGPEITETLTVQRPFQSRLDAGDSARISAIGAVATGGDAQDWSRIEVPIGPAGGDVDLSALLDDPPRPGIFERRGHRTLADRRCEVIRFGGPVTGGVLSPVGTTPGEYADVCIDGVGLVLAERWVIDDVPVRDREATAVTEGPVDTDAFRIPADATSLSTDEGGGAVAPTDADAPSGFAESWHLRAAPEGFDHLGRWAVVPPTIDTSRSPGPDRRPVQVALVTDVWTREGDVIVLDQGAAIDGSSPPWAPAEVTEMVELGRPGDAAVEAEAVWGAALNELRVRRPDGGFVRLAGTVPMAELVALGRTLTTEA